MRAALILVPVLLAGCFTPAHCGPTPTSVTWQEPEFASILVEAEPDGWAVHEEPRPYGLPVEHPWLDTWNAGIRAIDLRTENPTEGGEHDHGRERSTTVRLGTPARVYVHVLADRDPQEVRPTVLRLLEALTDGNESRRAAWADELLAEPDLPEGVDYPVPEHRSFMLLPYELDLPRERLRVQAFVDEHFEPEGAVPALALEDWSVSVRFADVAAVGDRQEFRANPRQNEFRDGSWHEEYGTERALEDFRAAYASLGVGDPPEDASVESVIC